MTSQTSAIGAVVGEPGGRFEIEAIILDEPRDDEIVVAISYVGICHTDIAARDGHLGTPFPAVFGHEGVGIVHRVGSNVTEVSVGDLVVTSESFCGACPRCAAGETPYCDRQLGASFGIRPDGSRMLHSPTRGALSGLFLGQSSFASHALVKARNAVLIPSDVPLHLVTPMACSALTGAGSVIHELRPSRGSSIAVFGVGGVGLSAVLAAKELGCDPIIAVDLVPSRLELAKGMGATATIDASEIDAVRAVRSLTDGSGADHVLEVTGVASVGAQAVRATSRRGTCVIAGVAPASAQLELDWTTVLAGRTIKGALMGSSDPRVFIPHLLDLYRAGSLGYEAMVRIYDFADINRAADDMLSGEVVKPVLRLPPP